MVVNDASTEKSHPLKSLPQNIKSLQMFNMKKNRDTQEAMLQV